MAITMVLILSACQTQPQPMVDEEPPVGFVQPETLSELVEVADLIVVARIADARSGRVVGDADSSLQFIEVELNIEERLKGDKPPGALLVETEKAGSPYTKEWRKEGQRVLAFLTFKGEAEFYRPFVPESVFALDGDDVKSTVGRSEWELVAELEARRLPELLAEIRHIADST